MAAEALARNPTLAVFASDRGPGDPERASIMSQAGTLMARRGARLVCLAEGGSVPVPLITSARAAGGDVLILADATVKIPAALATVPVERIDDAETRLARAASTEWTVGSTSRIRMFAMLTVCMQLLLPSSASGFPL